MVPFTFATIQHLKSKKSTVNNARIGGRNVWKTGIL
jgi:hypothetical protein